MSSPNPQELLNSAQTGLGVGIGGLNAAIARVVEDLGNSDKYNSALASHLAYLTDAGVKVVDGLRKVVDHARKTVEAMTPEEKEELLIEYVESQPRDARARIIARLAAIDAEEGVLGAKAQVKAAKPKRARKASK